jgi:hypothetical protein
MSSRGELDNLGVVPRRRLGLDSVASKRRLGRQRKRKWQGPIKG